MEIFIGLVIILVAIVSLVLEYSFNKEDDSDFSHLQNDKEDFIRKHQKKVEYQCPKPSDISNVMYAYCAGRSLLRKGKTEFIGKEWVSSMEGRIDTKTMELMALYFDKGMSENDNCYIVNNFYHG